MQSIKIKVAGNITYSGFTYNTPLLVEYKHTGKEWHIKNKFTSSLEIAERWKAEGRKVIEKPGHYFISRIAIPNVMADGLKDWWYITNEGDNYKVNKASKYWKKIHSQLSNNINPF